MRVVTALPLDDWRKVGAAARAAEADGYDGVMSAEVAHDPFIPLAVAALATQRLELSTGIAVAFPRSPMIVANLAWDLQAHSGGRFSLGLGSQVKGHNVRRFSLPWSAPVPRLREYVESLRAIWRAWEKREKLDYRGEHYRFTLMTPEFTPVPTGLPMVPVSIAAVGPAMLRLAGRVCDGVRLHPFCSRKYMQEVGLPQLEAGLAASGKARENFEISDGGFIATGPDDAAVQEAIEETRYRIAFYGSTRTYLPVLACHGLEDLGAKLHRLSVEGRWNEMAAQVPGDVVRLFTAVGTYAEIASALETRFGGITDVLHVQQRPGTDPGVIQDTRRIPCAFRGFASER